MGLIWFHAFLILVAFIFPIYSASCDGENGEVEFKMLQLSHKTSCRQLTQGECWFIHECMDKCPCTCENRMNGDNPNGEEGNGDNGQNRGTGGGGHHDEDEDYDDGDDGDDGYAEDGDIDGDTYDEDQFSGDDLNSLFCFHGDSMVTTDKGPRRMAELLNITDAKVLAWDVKTNQPKLSPVRFWLHAHPNHPATFIRFTTEKGKQLLITANHVIYRSAKCQNPVESVLAGQVIKNDCLIVKEKGKMQQQRVERINEEKYSGIYAPVTEEGTIIVDDVAASCYAQNENIEIQKLISKYTMLLFDLTRFIWPEVKPNNDISIPSIYLAFNKLQKYFLN